MQNSLIDDLYSFDILLLGDDGVGKSQLLNRWINNQFSEQHLKTIGLEFEIKPIYLSNKNIKLCIWDTSNESQYIPIINQNILSSNLILIIIPANNNKQQKLEQISRWLNFISRQNTSKAKIAIIETKSDLSDATYLTTEDLAPFNNKYVMHHIISTKTTYGLDTFYNKIKLCITQSTSPGITSQIADKVSSLNINDITQEQAKILLHSLKSLLMHGPLNEIKKSYQLSFFGGGKSINNIDNNKYVVPNHVKTWIAIIDKALEKSSEDLAALTDRKSFNDQKNYKTILSQLYYEFLNTAATKPFRRSITTQDFYKKCLPGFIQHSSTRSFSSKTDYFTVRENIEQLTGFDALLALNTLINKLKHGPLNNTRQPYKVSYFGSHKVEIDNNHLKIKAPRHIASLLDFLMRNPFVSTTEKLIFALDFSIATKFSSCRNRDPSTQDFYNTLPEFIACTIAEKAPDKPHVCPH